MFNELDVVKLKRELNEQLPVGTIGVVHQVYQLSDVNRYLVEFVDEGGDMICLSDVSESDIELSNK